MIGERYGRYTVVALTDPSSGMRRVQCRCDCGELRIVFAKNLKSGNSRSCGCLNNERTAVRNRIHGAAKSPTWSRWVAMRRRCSEKSVKNRKWYADRGIRVCERWSKYENFLADMGEAPIGAQLDRIDNSKGYEPGNCRWTTPKSNSRNRSNNTTLTLDGRSMCVTEWAEVLGWPRHVISNRLRDGWDVRRTLTQSPRLLGRRA